MDLITERAFTCIHRVYNPLVRNSIFDISSRGRGWKTEAYSYSSADVLDGRPFRVAASLRRIFQQLDARRTVRQVYPGGTVVSNDPYRHPPPRSVVLRVLFRVTSNSKRFAFVHPILLPPLDRVVTTTILPSSRRLTPFFPPPSQKGVFLFGILTLRSAH